MTYKWEAIAQDLTEERDRLLKENGALKAALHNCCSDIEALMHDLYGDTTIMPLSHDRARAALKSEKQ